MYYKLKLFIIVSLSVFTYEVRSAVRESKLVTIAQGPVRGYKNPDHDIFEFFGIPYATAPTGAQRFTAPLPAPRWTSTLDAIYNGIICPQGILSTLPSLTMQEDCLIANIQVPNTEERNLPVLVVVHGGAYHSGFGHMFDPKKFTASKKLITVTFNYRLGAHGFLCLGTKDAPGNAGMKDQIALLRWVKDNIAHFGGNPDDVTISGYSAGGSSVDLLMISKAAEGLFNKVIPESGANIAPWSVSTDPVRLAQQYAQLLNFTNVDDLDALEEFYKTISFDDLNSVDALDIPESVFYFTPCIENDLGEERFLEDSPVNIIKSGQYKKVPMLYGFTDMEGLYRIPVYDDWVKKMNEHFSDFLPADLEFKNEDEKETVAQSVREFYFDNNRIGIHTIFSYINFYTDVIFNGPTLRSAKMLLETGHDSIYLYEYTFYKIFPSVPGVPDALINKPGADHTAQTEALYDFSIASVNEEAFTEEYRRLRAIMLELWINFITTGRPVPEGSSLPAWPPATINRTPHMHLGDTVELRNSPLIPDRIQLWEDIYEKHYRQPIPPQSASSASAIRHNLAYTLAIFVFINMIFK